MWLRRVDQAGVDRALGVDFACSLKALRRRLSRPPDSGDAFVRADEEGPVVDDAPLGIEGDELDPGSQAGR